MTFRSAVFHDYAALGVAGLAFNASLWADKFVAWWLVGGAGASLHAGASTIAWLSTIPCLAWIFIEVETSFHRRTRRFYQLLEGEAPRPELRRGAQAVVDEATRLLRGALFVQAVVTAILLLGAEYGVRWLKLPPGAIEPFRLLLVAAGAQAVSLLGLMLLYHFNLRREACLAAAGLLAAVLTLTTAATMHGLPPSAGTVLGSAIGSAIIWKRVSHGVGAVLTRSLLSQPYASERRKKMEAVARA